MPFLERVITCNMSRLERILRLLRLHARDRGLEPSSTVYKRWGKNPKRRLIFSKTRHARLELAYATQYLRGSRKAAYHSARTAVSGRR